MSFSVTKTNAPLIEKTVSFEDIASKSTKSAIGTHVSWLKKRRDDPTDAFLVNCFAKLEIGALCLSGVGIVPLVKAREISKKLDSYVEFEREKGLAIPPEKQAIFLKTKTETFNHLYYYMIHEEKLWYKPIEGECDWSMIYFDGNQEVVPVEIGADGANLIVIDNQGKVHYKKVINEKNQLEKVKRDNWKDKWFSLPYLHHVYNVCKGKRLQLPEAHKAWAISHRGQYSSYYTDIKKKQHFDPVGVTSFYLLSKDGKEIHIADPWLPFGFHHKISGPRDSTFVAENISASASTIFLIGQGLKRYTDAEGKAYWKKCVKLYTRLADFDTTGKNPLRKYSFETSSDPKVYELPPEDWYEEPVIALEGKAKITKVITILQTGTGNTNRELRVQGTNKNGDSGYYSKSICKPLWDFIQTDEVIEESAFFEQDVVLEKIESFSDTMQGEYSSSGEKVSLLLENFHAAECGSDLICRIGEKKIKAKLYSKGRLLNILGAKTPSYTVVVSREYFDPTQDTSIRNVASQLFHNKTCQEVAVKETKIGVEIQIGNLVQNTTLYFTARS